MINIYNNRDIENAFLTVVDIIKQLTDPATGKVSIPNTGGSLSGSQVDKLKDDIRKDIEKQIVANNSGQLNIDIEKLKLDVLKKLEEKFADTQKVENDLQWSTTHW